MSIIKECPHCLKQLRACEVEDHIKDIFNLKHFLCNTCSFTSDSKDHADSHIKMSNHTILEKSYDKKFFNEIIKYNTTLFMNYLSRNITNNSKVYLSETISIEGDDIKEIDDIAKDDCKFTNSDSEKVFNQVDSSISNDQILQKHDNNNDQIKFMSNEKLFPQSIKKFQHLLSMCSEIGNPNTKEIVTILRNMTINGNKTIILPEGQLIELNIDEEISKNKIPCKLCEIYVNGGYHSRRSHVIENHYNKIQSLFNSKRLQSMKNFIDCISKTIKICFNNSLVKHDNQCVKCGNFYNNKQLMINHVIIAHPIKIIGVVCTYPNCHYFSPTLKDILRHRQKHIQIDQNNFINDIPSDVPTAEIYKKITKYFFPFYHILNGNFNEPNTIHKTLPKIINRKRSYALIEE